MAMTAFRIPPGPGWYTPNVFVDPKILAFRKKVFTEGHQAATQLSEWNVNGQWRKLPAKIVVTARGRSYESETEYTKGDPWLKDTYFTDEEIKAKFRNMSGPVAITSEKWQRQIEKIMDMTFDLDKVKDISDLTRLLSP